MTDTTPPAKPSNRPDPEGHEDSAKHLSDTGQRIEDYAVVGDKHTMALVGLNGSVDWLCLPRFDSDACFTALLGDEDNGRWQVCPRGYAKGVVKRTSRRYRPGTLVLETEWETETGVVRLVDAMPTENKHTDFVRQVIGVEGEVEMAMRWVIRFGYGSVMPWVRRFVDDDGFEALIAIAGPDAVVLRGDVLPRADHRSEDKAHHAYFTLKAGETVDLSLMWYPSHQPVPHVHDVGKSIRETEEQWQEWSSRSTYDGPHKEAVERSLLVLKAMTYDPTGGIVAAPTTSLPEEIGGQRNWDYRFCWLRDASLALSALLSASYTTEAHAWREWLLRAVAGAPEQVRIVYGLGGERHLPEEELYWLPGYEGSKPVRTGNGASRQFQLDVYGEMAAAFFMAAEQGIDGDSFSWAVQRAGLEYLETVLDRPDRGIWEVRGPERHFVHSRVMVWVAFDRAVRMVEEFGLEGPVDHWKQLREQVHEEVCEKGWNEELGAFTQYYGGRELDASVLVMSAMGFLEGDDPRMLSTIDAINAKLRRGPLVDRYETTEEIDGLPPGEGAFLACSFWLVTALAHAGRHDEAEKLFDELLELRNDVGLLAEEYDDELGRMTGNFPQAFSHLALVEAAMALTAAEEGDSPAPDEGTREATD